jgi:sulfite exporter TauE/SafE
VVEYPLIFLAGLAGSWHCAGMCGGFACALGSDPRNPTATLVRQLTYNLGRVTTYCFIGALVGFLAAGLCASEPGAPPTSGAQRVLAITSGLLMVFIG